MGPLSVEKSNMLTKRTTKTEKFEKPLKTDIMKNFETIRYQLTALRNIIHSILSDKLMRPLGILRLQKELIKNS